MISIQKMKLIRSLQHKKYRDQQGLFVVEGEKMVLEMVKDSDGWTHPEMIFATAEWLDDHRGHIGKGINLVEATSQELSRASSLVTPQPVLALAKIPESEWEPLAAGDSMALGFEAIRDPGNLGTIIRTADWFGIGEIVCTPDSVDQFNPKVIQSTMGSFLRVRVSYMELEPLLAGLSNLGRPLFGTFLEGENIYDTDLEKNPLVLFGNESKGISEKLIPHIQKKICIPSFGSSRAESLNLAASVAVVCSEVRRRG